MPCSITLNFTVDKISVKFLVDSEAAGEYNPKKMPESVFEKGFLQDVRHNLWEIVSG